MLLYIDYNTQISKNFIIGPADNKIKIFRQNGAYFMDHMDGSKPKSYSRIKYLVNEMDNEILDHLDNMIF